MNHDQLAATVSTERCRLGPWDAIPTTGYASAFEVRRALALGRTKRHE